MIEDVLVVDATVHAFNFGVENYEAPFVSNVVKMLYHFSQDQIHPQGDPGYRLSFKEFQDLFQDQPEILEEALFRESLTDVAVYHGVPLYGLFGDGSSPIYIAEKTRSKWPHRMHIYGDISPWREGALERMDALVDDHNVIGVKFYPLDLVDGRIHATRFDDESNMFPLIERARQKGLKVIAIHKAVPFGPLMIDNYHVGDMRPAIETFPDMTFEIVHGGFAFVEETAALLEKYENVSVNLETNPCFAVNMADKFADMMAPLLATGAHERLFYASGATGAHPGPYIEAFWNFKMPTGYPKLTEEMKAGILGANFARQHGWDVEAIKKSCAEDEFGWEKTLAEPWGPVRERRAPGRAVAGMA